MSQTLPTILATETVAQSALFRVEALDLRFSNGVQRRFERFASSGSGRSAVLIVPLLDEDTVLLVREYACGLHRYELGLPKGRVEPGEDLLAGANRELMEEIGHGARRLERLATLSIAPAYISHVSELVLAQDLYPQKLEGDEPEPLEVVPWPLSRLDTLLAGGECSEARSIAALFMVRERLRAGLA
jgi:ADP-ribose diphosphatase